jgi:hypothetical protein
MWVKEQIDTYIPSPKIHNPREINLICDVITINLYEVLI